LADALSEKTPVKRTVIPRQTVTATGADQSPQETSDLPSSISRVVALFGTLVLAAVLLGVGYGMIWSLFTRGQIPKLDGIGPYLMGGAALFAPYAFNQLKEAFKPSVQQ
jgi:hypothetical protein